MKHATVLICGLLFGVGLSLSGMSNPNNVIQFLDVTGNWNPSLLFVLGAAVITCTIGYAWVFRLQAPVCDSTFHLPQKTKIDRKLLLGATLFGIGWGMAGYCPGAAIAALGAPNQEVITFVIAMLIGIAIRQKFK